MADPKSTSKPCNACGATKPPTEFYARDAKCKTCRRVIERARYHRNIERRRVTALAWRQTNSPKVCAKKRQDRIDRPDVYKARDRAKYQKHGDRIRAARVAYVAANKPAIRAARKKHYDATRDDQIANTRAWRKANQARAVASSTAWAKAHPAARRRHHQDRRARKRNAFVESVDVPVLVARDRGRCGICLKRVAAKDRSIDHIIPLSLGGEHSYKNTQLAHRRCNTMKNARIKGQLRLL